MELTGIEVNGSRLPTTTVVRLSGLKVGQQVNYDILNDACNKITSTGLVSAVDYAYNVQPGKPGVVVSLKLWDEMPLLPAKVYPPEDTDEIWKCLRSADPVFTPELPNTKAALHFYSENIEHCLANGGLVNLYVASSVVCDAKGKASQVVFDVREKLPAQHR